MPSASRHTWLAVRVSGEGIRRRPYPQRRGV
jgi:hypothetical protein